ncbi:hypothetical protein [Clostridium cochlearium]|uniref:hypothetical protein n=1 Tax=Clostridium cochlearium TaxID=1494 RepID=UPI00148D71EB|nr:hypothetical protein [Clostridium cochlearium]
MRDSNVGVDPTKHEIESSKIGSVEGNTLKNVPDTTTLKQLKEALKLSAGAEVHFVKKTDRDNEIKDLNQVVTDEYEIVVVAKGGTTGYYEIEVQ